mmetsp:Transcript_4542/g.5811  ORF Transcript_4542/g.5811 Transcript_4542/m.5811 type:complete len:709 (-) Transcript_4542:153-2279(-)
MMSYFRWIVAILFWHQTHSRRIVPSHNLTTITSTWEEYDPSFLRDQRRLSHNTGGNNPNDRLIVNLPNLKKYEHRQWAGYVDVEKGKGHLFYWLFEAWDNPGTAPLVVWLNGGPGCSSMDGLFLENGPFKLSSDLTVNVNPYSWAASANVLYIDQPVGTGLSFTKGTYPKNDGDVNRALLEFFDGFYQVHRDLIGREVYLTGESHAGHYIPSFAKSILLRSEKQQQNNNKNKDKNSYNSYEVINLGGLAIGNGWFDPHHQYGVSTFAHGAGLISSGQVIELKQREKTCQKKLNSGIYMSSICWDLLDDIVKQSGPSGKPKVLMYDIRKYAKSSNGFPPGHDLVEKYLNLKEVRAAIHASQCPLKFKECTDPPYNALKHQDGLGVTKDITYLLDKGVRTLFFNGQYDMICNHIGVEMSLEALQWKGSKEFSLATPSVWTVDSSPAGYLRNFGPLSLLLVLDSGHMVPLDKPKQALDMITRFIKKKSFADSKGGIKARSFVSSEVQDSSIKPPVIQEDPLPGDTMVAVSFEHNRGEAPRRSSGSTSSSSSSSSSSSGLYVVTSSPEGITAIGSSSPIVVTGLTNGIAYTFTVISEIHENNIIKQSLPSAGSIVVTPGCGASLTDDLILTTKQAQRTLLLERGQKEEEEEELGMDGDGLGVGDNLELSFIHSSSNKIGCHHGLCTRDAEGIKDICLCFPGYTGEKCTEERV